MKASKRITAALVVACICMCSAQALAQGNGWTGGVGGNWTANTWQFGSPPSPDFDPMGIVGWGSGSSSTVGAVSVTGDIRASHPSPTVVLGNGLDPDNGATSSGTLNITSSGAFSVVVGGGAGSTGDLNVGLNGGIGILNVSGTLEVGNLLSLNTNANAASTVTFSGSANVTAISGFFDRNLVIDGSNVSASFANNLTLGQAGVHTWRIPSSGASTVLVGGNADINGTLRLQFPNGAPTVGTTWNLIDSATVDANETPASGFSNIDATPVIGLTPGATFVVRSVTDAGSTNGTYTQLALEQHPVLVVDRSTGTASIRNYHSSVATVAFDTYVVGSALGSLNPAGWTSIAPANGWVEANPSSTALSELIPMPGGSTSIAASSSISLGTPISLPAPSVFGEENEDITFRFAKPADSTFTEGRVIYTGLPNNTLTLNVDPNTGEAQIVNGTNFTVSIENYVISSANGSLNFANGPPANTWNSLQDQGASNGDWFEANPSSTQISELLVSGGMVLAPNDTVNIGSPFNDTLGAEDLVFQFALVDNSAGDYNGDGTINAADYVVWRKVLSSGSNTLFNDPTPGTVDGFDLQYWRSHFGESASPASPGLLTGKILYGPLVSLGSGDGGDAPAVPEPGTGALGVIGLAVFSFLAAAHRRTMT